MAQIRSPASVYGFWIPGSRQKRAPRNDGKAMRDKRRISRRSTHFSRSTPPGQFDQFPRLVVGKSLRLQLHAPMHRAPERWNRPGHSFCGIT
jgi:hypothetical protein